MKTIAAAVFGVIFQLIVIQAASQQAWVWALLNGREFVAAMMVLLISFGITLVIVYRADLAVDEVDGALAGRGEGKPDVEAYIEQMLAANGTHLNRD